MPETTEAEARWKWSEETIYEYVSRNSRANPRREGDRWHGLTLVVIFAGAADRLRGAEEKRNEHEEGVRRGERWKEREGERVRNGDGG